MEHSLNPNQHTYQAGYSMESALYSHIESYLERKGFVVGVLVDIEGAFNHTSCWVICGKRVARAFRNPWSAG